MYIYTVCVLWLFLSPCVFARVSAISRMSYLCQRLQPRPLTCYPRGQKVLHDSECWGSFSPPLSGETVQNLVETAVCRSSQVSSPLPLTTTCTCIYLHGGPVFMIIILTSIFSPIRVREPMHTVWSHASVAHCMESC